MDDIQAEAACDRRQIYLAVLASIAGAIALISLIVGLAIVAKYVNTTRCPLPAAEIVLPE